MTPELIVEYASVAAFTLAAVLALLALVTLALKTLLEWRYADLLGRERVMAGVDCGFSVHAGSNSLDPEIVWAKLAALSEGAAIASTAASERFSLRASTTKGANKGAADIRPAPAA